MNLIKRIQYRRIILDLRFAIIVPRFTQMNVFHCRHHGPRSFFYEIEHQLLKIKADHPEKQVCARCLIGDLKKALARCPRCRRYIVPLRLLDAPFVNVSDLCELSPEAVEQIIADEHSCDPRDYTNY